mgnify:FL=1
MVRATGKVEDPLKWHPEILGLMLKMIRLTSSGTNKNNVAGTSSAANTPSTNTKNKVEHKTNKDGAINSNGTNGSKGADRKGSHSAEDSSSFERHKRSSTLALNETNNEDDDDDDDGKNGIPASLDVPENNHSLKSSAFSSSSEIPPSLRREVLRTLGTMGAVDPFRLREYDRVRMNASTKTRDGIFR